MKEVIVHTYLGAKKKGFLVSTFFIKNCIYLFLERGGKREEERDRNINVGEKYPSVVSPMCPDRDEPHRQPRHM